MKGSRYLRDPRFSPDLSRLIFCFRMRNYGVRNNFRNQYAGQNINCPLCEQELDRQRHTFDCSIIKQVIGTNNIKGKYEDLFEDDLDKLYIAAKTMQNIVEIRKVLLDP